jgi:hypothetical protein
MKKTEKPASVISGKTAKHRRRSLGCGRLLEEQLKRPFESDDDNDSHQST